MNECVDALICQRTDLDIYQKHAYRLYQKGYKFEYSTGICGEITAGYGELDLNGYWDFPLKVNQETMEIEL